MRIASFTKFENREQNKEKKTRETERKENEKKKKRRKEKEEGKGISREWGREKLKRKVTENRIG